MLSVVKILTTFGKRTVGTIDAWGGGLGNREAEYGHFLTFIVVVLGTATPSRSNNLLSCCSYVITHSFIFDQQ